LKISFRQGWLGSPRRNFNSERIDSAASALKSFISYRIFLGLDAQAIGQVPPPKADDDAPPGDDEGAPDDAGPPGFVTGLDIEI
jgi:hypothetical protein